MGLCCSNKTRESVLTHEEIEAVRELWIRAKSENVGKKILMTLIERRPKFAEYFGIQSESLDLKVLNQSKAFQLQACRIQNFLDTAVGSLGFCPLSSIYDMAHRVGQIHFYRGVNFGADNWLVFKKVTVDQVTLASKANHGAQIALNDNCDVTFVYTEGKLLSLVKGDCIQDLLVLLSIRKASSYSTILTSLTTQRTGQSLLAVRTVNRKGFLEEAMRNCKEETGI